MWYMIRNLRCTVTIDSVLANSKTQNAFLFTVNAIYLHDYPLAVEPGSTPRPLVQKKLGEILYLLIFSFLTCLSWLLRSRVLKSQRDLRITLYILSIRGMSSINIGHLITKIITTLQNFATLHHTSPNCTSLHLSTLHFLSFTLHYPLI